MTYTMHLPSPIGIICLASDGKNLTGLWLEGQKYFGATMESDAVEKPDLEVFRKTTDWLAAYFAGRDLPDLPSMAPRGTPFRQIVWQLLQEIPLGETVTYGALAEKLRSRGFSGSARAVGGAVGHNPISILIPCHRVIGADGRLTGYAGGTEKKRWLLELEGVDLCK